MLTSLLYNACMLSGFSRRIFLVGCWLFSTQGGIGFSGKLNSLRFTANGGENDYRDEDDEGQNSLDESIVRAMRCFKVRGELGFQKCGWRGEQVAYLVGKALQRFAYLGSATLDHVHQSIGDILHEIVGAAVRLKGILISILLV